METIWAFMCRLFALISQEKGSSEFHSLMLSFQKQAVEHPQGWGFGWYEDGRARVVKRPVSAFQNPEFLKTAGDIESDLVIAHIRKATEGSKLTMENTHPFMHENWSFAHNGTIDIAEMLKNQLPESYRARLKGQTDTEVFFQWILFRIDERGDAEDGIMDAVRFIQRKKGEGSSAMNFLLSDGHRLFAFRCAFKKVNYYSLHYLRRQDMVVVSSDPLTNEDWVPIALEELLVIDKKLRMSSVTI